MTDAPILSVEQVAVGYGRQPVLTDVSFTLARGSFTGLLGANGSGKSTLIKTILGIIPPLKGGIRFNSGGGIFGYVPQRDALDAAFLVSSFEVVLMGSCARVPAGRRVNKGEKDWALHCLKQTGAEQLARMRFAELSGGQKQRVLIARALAAKPDFLLLDEPTAGIDTAARRAVMELLREIHQQQQLTILMSSHDLPAVRANAENVIWLHHGRIRQGSARELLSPERIEEFLEMEAR